MKKQEGLIKEILIILAVIFILAYFNLDPEKVWDVVTDFFIDLYNKVKS